MTTIIYTKRGIERGESNVGLVNIHRIADALKVEPAELFREG
jgi:hypothetical protein